MAQLSQNNAIWNGRNATRAQNKMEMTAVLRSLPEHHGRHQMTHEHHLGPETKLNRGSEKEEVLF